MAKFLITGANGFIGLHLAEFLAARGHQVRALVRRAPPEELTALGAEIVTGDLNNQVALEQATAGVDYVIHLAGLVAAPKKEDLTAANETGTRNIARAAAGQTKPPVFVYVSSIAAGGPARAGEIRTEDEPAAPVSDYGRSKQAGEAAAVQFADRMPLTIVRPGIVFGPRNRAILPILKTIQWVRFHPAPTLRSPPLSFIHVDDLNEIILRAAERGARIDPKQGATGPGVYYAVAPEYLDYSQWGKTLRMFIRRPFAPTIPLPYISLVAAAVNEQLARLRGAVDQFNLDKIREASAPSWACSPERVRRELDFTPPRTLNERFAELVDWYRREGWV